MPWWHHFYSSWQWRKKNVCKIGTVMLSQPPNSIQRILIKTSFTDYTVRVSVIKAQAWLIPCFLCWWVIYTDAQVHPLLFTLCACLPALVPWIHWAPFPISAPDTAWECTKGAQYLCCPSLYLREHISPNFCDSACCDALQLCMTNSFWHEN